MAWSKHFRMLLGWEKLEKHSPTARVFQAFLNSRNILSVFGSRHPNTEPIRYLFNIIITDLNILNK